MNYNRVFIKLILFYTMVEAIDPRSINNTISDLINPMGANESQMYDSIDSGLKGKLLYLLR